MDKELLDWLAGSRRETVLVRGEPHELRVVTARELLEARREAQTLMADESERALCSNACLLARALERDGLPAFASGGQLLEQLTPGEIRQLADRLGRLNQTQNPSSEDSAQEVQQLKKALGTRRTNG